MLVRGSTRVSKEAKGYSFCVFIPYPRNYLGQRIPPLGFFGTVRLSKKVFNCFHFVFSWRKSLSDHQRRRLGIFRHSHVCEIFLYKSPEHIFRNFVLFEPQAWRRLETFPSCSTLLNLSPSHEWSVKEVLVGRCGVGYCSERHSESDVVYHPLDA